MRLSWCAEIRVLGDRPTRKCHYEAERQLDVNLIIEDFVSGKKQDRLRHIKPEDHR